MNGTKRNFNKHDNPVLWLEQIDFKLSGLLDRLEAILEIYDKLYHQVEAVQQATEPFLIKEVDLIKKLGTSKATVNRMIKNKQLSPVQLTGSLGDRYYRYAEVKELLNLNALLQLGGNPRQPQP